jgi:hypothetical protein
MPTIDKRGVAADRREEGHSRGQPGQHRDRLAPIDAEGAVLGRQRYDGG